MYVIPLFCPLYPFFGSDSVSASLLALLAFVDYAFTA
jgi:hypothetical protein